MSASDEQVIDELKAAHVTATKQQQQMRDAAADRNGMILAALDRGVSAVAIAEALGVDRQRVYQMAKAAR